jgi:UDP-glucose 4-epimerase
MSLTHSHEKPQKPSRVVVLGASGFLGRGIVAALTRQGTEVLPLGSRDIDLSGAEAGTALASRLREGDALVFLSAITPDKGRDSAALMRNLAMGRAVCEAAKKVKLAHLVYASSDAVYPFTAGLVSEESPAAVVDLYGAMHRTREIMLAAEAPVPLAVLRPTAVYGHGDTHNSYGPNRFVRMALKESRIPLFGNGEETRDHLYIDDAVAIVVAIIAHGSRGLLNLASGQSESFRTVAEMVAAGVGKSVTIEPSPRQNPVTHRHFATTALMQAFPALRLTPLADGLKRMIAAATADLAP